MSGRHAVIRTRHARAARAWSLLPGVLLIGALLAGGLHHHDAREDASHPCAVCALSSAPAALTVAVAIAAPLSHVTDVAPRRTATPPPARVHRAPTRAPPAA